MAGEPPMERWRPATFEGFKLHRVLAHNLLTNYVAVLGSFEGRDGEAVVSMNRQQFDAARLGGMLSADTSLAISFHNDIYSKFSATVPADYALVNVDIVYPATERHIQKYLEQPVHMVRETPEMYHERVQPFIQSIPPARLNWVYNILEKKAEVERLIFEDPDPTNGFMLHPDMKWDQTMMQQLYCLALCHRRDIPCLRSLTAEHLPLLRNIRTQASKAVEDKYHVPANDLRIFVHYPPSYFHFHVHVTHVKAVYGMGANVGKAHLLDDIIDNIETFGSDFYQRRALTLVVGENEDMWRLLQDTQGSAAQPAQGAQAT